MSNKDLKDMIVNNPKAKERVTAKRIDHDAFVAIRFVGIARLKRTNYVFTHREDDPRRGYLA